MQRGLALSSENWLSAQDFTADGKTLVISKVESVEVEPDKTKKVVFFKDEEKGLVLNEVNTRIIESNTGESDTNNWAGYPVTLYATSILWRDTDTPCIRIKQLVNATAFKEGV